MKRGASVKYYIYVLKSTVIQKRYIGYTSKDPWKRLKEHNQGGNKWTRSVRPLELIYYETYDTSQEARKREKFLKTGRGREFLSKIIPA
jgi:putative endonuclease